MAIERMSLAEIKARGVTINRVLVEATTEENIERHRSEDAAEAGLYDDMVATPDPTSIRRRFDNAEQGFAEAIGVPLTAVQGWEQRRDTIDPTAGALLLVLEREPQAARRALAR